MTKKKYPSTRDMIAPVIDVIGVGVTSQVVAASGATGPTRTILDQVPVVMSVGVLQKQRKRIRWL